MSTKTPRARLDADRTAKPLTELVAHVDPNHCFFPGRSGDLEYRTTAEARGSHVTLTRTRRHAHRSWVIRSKWTEPKAG